MAILIDADVILQAERGIFDLDRWLTSNPLEEFKLATITVAELWHSADRATGDHRAERQPFLERFLAVFDFVPYTEHTALEHARLWVELESSGKMIGSYELILAATAIQAGYTLATFNKRRFAAVKDLSVIEPV
jgi:predicted nucleic acid-binding protein